MRSPRPGTAAPAVPRRRPGPALQARGRRARTRRPPGRPRTSGHRGRRRGGHPEPEDQAVGPDPRMRLGHPGQAHGQQRGNRERGQGARHPSGQADQAGPAEAGDQEGAAAEAERPQRGVLHRVEEAHPGQQLSQDEHADHREQGGHQPQRDGLQVDGALGVRRLGGQRVALHVLAPGEPAQLALDGGQVGGPVPEPEGHSRVVVEAGAVRPVEGRGRPDRVGARPGLRREL